MNISTNFSLAKHQNLLCDYACRVLVCLFAFLLFPVYVQADSIPVAIFSNRNKVMTFAYGDYKVDNQRVFPIPTEAVNNAIDIPWNSLCKKVEKVVFDSSFANFRPKNTTHWFNDFIQLSQICGLKNLNTSEVTNMDGMFAFCDSLRSVDLSSFYFDKLNNVGFSFTICDSLENIIVKGSKMGNFLDCTKFNILYYYDEDVPKSLSSSIYSDCKYSFAGGYFKNLHKLSRNDQLSILIPITDACIPLGQSYNPNVSITPAYSHQGFTVSSSNKSVATVDTSGVIHAVGLGKADIKYTSSIHPELSTTCHVKVISASLATTTVKLQSGQSYSQQEVTFQPEGTNVDLEVVSANGNIASIDDNGSIKGVAPGKADIYYMTNCGLIAATCHVIVYDSNVDYVGGIYYRLGRPSSGQATVTSIYGDRKIDVAEDDVPQIYSGTINIPPTVTYKGTTYKVTRVGTNAFSYQHDLQAIVVPPTVNEIEAKASYSSHGLQLVTIEGESDLVNVGENAFARCTKLRRVTFNGTTRKMKSIDKYAFAGCPKLERVKWIGESSLNTIDDYAFYQCPSLNHFEMPNSVTLVGKHSFRYNSGLTDIHLSSTLSMIDEYAFGECGFSHITLPNSLASIQASAFINNSHLTSITIPERVEGIGAACFENNAVLDTVTFLTEIHTMTIGNNGFNKCPSLTHVNITHLDSWAETNFNNDKANPANTSHHIFMNGQEVTNVVLPDNTLYVNSNAFNGCTAITSVDMPESIQHVNDDIFTGCSSLKSVICRAEEVPLFIGTNDPSAMNDVFNRATLYVLPSKLNDYKEDSWWGRFYKILPIKEPSATGDANGDGKIDVADIVGVNDYLLLSPPDNFDETAADANKDGHISVSDISAIIDLILAQTTSTNNVSGAKAAIGIASSSAMLYQRTSTNTLAVALEEDRKYSAMQMDVMLPESVGNAKVTLSDECRKHHTLAYNMIGDRLRIVVYSLNNDLLSGGQPLLNIQFANQGDYKNVDITNVVASSQDAVSRQLGVRYDNFGGATNIKSVDNRTTELRSMEGGIMVYGVDGELVSVHSLSGMLFKTCTIKGGTSFIELSSGVYLVSIKNRTYKVFVK